jgi:hypothetical protein
MNPKIRGVSIIVEDDCNRTTIPTYRHLNIKVVTDGNTHNYNRTVHISEFYSYFDQIMDEAKEKLRELAVKEEIIEGKK